MINEIYISDNVRVYLDREVPCIVWEPLQPMSDEEWEHSFKMGLNEKLRVLPDLPDISWLNNAAKMEPVGAEKIAWVRGYLNETAKRQGGCYRVAFVEPIDVFAQMSINLYISDTLCQPDNNLIIEKFQSLEWARNWLIREKVRV